MKKIALLLILISTSMHAQKIAKIDTGSIEGADYRIIFPENWKGKLVMYAHGYEFMGTSPRQSKTQDWPKRMTPFIDRGYAVAASDYQFQGLALARGVDDTEALRQYFVKKYGQPDSTFMAGHSMGGGITLATMEYYGKHYNGGLPMCPLADKIYLQTRKELDLIATFNALIPGYMPTLKDILDLDSKSQTPSMQAAFGKAVQMKREIFSKDSSNALDIAHRFDLKPDDLTFALVFGENVLRDVVQKLGGNPYDNTNTLYGGFSDNLYVNQHIERLEATVRQEKNFSEYDRTGEIDKPVLALHTMYDQLIPARMAIVPYENKVQQKGNQEYFTVKYTNGQGHCNFTEKQTGQVFDELRAWVQSGIKAKPGFIKD
jgi:pimeloyl-ACP methyl ester carboxylesterase